VIARTGKYSIFPKTGTALMAIGFLWLTFLTADKPVIWIMVGMFFIGLGLGQMMQTLTLASQNSVGPRDIGVATSSSTFFRQIGGTLGVAVLFSVLFSIWPTAIQTAAERPEVQQAVGAALADPAVVSDPANAGIIAVLQGAASGGSTDAVNGDTSFLTGADPRLTAPFLEGFNTATVTVYWVGLAVVLLALLLSLFLKTPPLRQKSALQENADNDAAVIAQEAADATGALVAPDAAPTVDAPEPPRRS
jgi:hypothetical protein